MHALSKEMEELLPNDKPLRLNESFQVSGHKQEANQYFLNKAFD